MWRRLSGVLAVVVLLGGVAQGTGWATTAHRAVPAASGPVVTSKPKVYIVFWGTQWGTSSTDSNGNLKFSNDTAGAAGQVQQMIKGLGTGGELWSGILTQYHVPYPTGGGVLARVWYDNASAAPSAATAAQIGSEAVKAAGHFGNTTAASNQYAQYVIFSAKGTNPDHYLTGNFCAWHESNGQVGVFSPYGTIEMTNLPYLLDRGTSCGENAVNPGTAGIVDGFTINEGAEYADSATGMEIATQCGIWTVGPKGGGPADVTMGNGTYAMPSLWSADTNECEISHPIVS
jgi:serine protease